ncbi:putative peptidoglycan glycosyltransferase FtsW [Frankliniella fusca]|uniref:Peptidoglycan glycosyltransferase FtsW n=1 Tax=Frankliniella fusca TaxID=407009 RepID=A0AAE1H671_9NEOP|nr:putative peptidoglycan glycosyltransferase FtsW [Frankliniella fusca]
MDTRYRQTCGVVFTCTCIGVSLSRPWTCAQASSRGLLSVQVACFSPFRPAQPKLKSKPAAIHFSSLPIDARVYTNRTDTHGRGIPYNDVDDSLV